MRQHAPRDTDSPFQKRLRSAIRAAGGNTSDLVKAIPILNHRTVNNWLARSRAAVPSKPMRMVVDDLLRQFWQSIRINKESERIATNGIAHDVNEPIINGMQPSMIVLDDIQVFGDLDH